MARTIGRLISNIVWLILIVITGLTIYIIVSNGFHYTPGTEFRLDSSTGMYNEQIIREPTDNNRW